MCSDRNSNRDFVYKTSVQGLDIRMNRGYLFATAFAVKDLGAWQRPVSQESERRAFLFAGPLFSTLLPGRRNQGTSSQEMGKPNVRYEWQGPFRTAHAFCSCTLFKPCGPRAERFVFVLFRRSGCLLLLVTRVTFHSVLWLSTLSLLAQNPVQFSVFHPRRRVDNDPGCQVWNGTSSGTRGFSQLDVFVSLEDR